MPFYSSFKLCSNTYFKVSKKNCTILCAPKAKELKIVPFKFSERCCYKKRFCSVGCEFFRKSFLERYFADSLKINLQNP